MKHIITLWMGWLPADRATAWLLALLGLLLAAPATVRSQIYMPIAVRVTPAGPLTFCAGSNQTLMAQAVVPAFVSGIGFNNTVRVTVVQRDGTTLVGGDFTTYNGSTRQYLARLKLDGSLDTNFGAGTELDGAVYAIKVQSDGKILIGGDFTHHGTTTCRRLARLMPDGTLDPTFDTGSTGRGFSGVVRAIEQQSTKDVVVGGDFQDYGGVDNSKYLVRLGSTGAFDATFATNTHTGLNLFNSSVWALALYTTDKLLVGGVFVAFVPGGRKGLARLDANGTLDTTFGGAGDGPSAGTIKAICLIDDGPMLVGGDFPGYDHNGVTTNSPALAYLDSSGAIVSTSTFASGFTNANAAEVRSISYGPSGFLIGGRFATYGGNPRNNLVSISNNGAVGTSFDVGTGFDKPVNSVTTGGTTSSYTVGGEFTTYKGSTSQRIARLTSTGSSNDTDTPVAGASFLWSNGATTPSITVSASGTYSAISSSYYNTATSNVVSVTVNPLPIAIAYAGAGLTICSGNTVQLGTAAVAGNTYNWSPSTGLSNPTAANPFLSLTNTSNVPTSQTYFLTVRNTATGCTASSQVLVTVNPALTISSITPTSGPVGTSVMINGTGLQGATVSFGGVPSSPAAVFNGQYLLATVPVGATTGPLLVTAPCGTVTVAFEVKTSLPVSTPTPIQPGSYTSIIVMSGGVGTLSGNVTADSVVVLDGGVLRLGPYQLLGRGGFRLASGGTLSLGHPGGLTKNGSTSTVSAVDMASRRYSEDASYIYTGSGTAGQATGAGLPSRVRNLTDSTRAGAALTLSAPTSVARVLTMASATDFNLNGKALTLLSAASGTALVVNGPAGGKVMGATGTMQRYIDPTFNSDSGYRYYSPPVAGATVATLGSTGFTPVVNPSYNTAANPLTVSPFPTVFRYDETRLGTLRPGLAAFDNGLLSPASLSEPLVVGAGYAVKIPATEKVTFVGTFTTGDQSLTLTRSSSPPASSSTGWNLVGNPYPAPLNWDLVEAADRPNLDAALYTYESTGPNAGIYFSYVNGVGGSPVVAAGKSFFVRVRQGQSNGRLSLRNRHRLTSYDTPAGFARPQMLDGLVELDLETAAEYNGGKKGGRPPTGIYSSELAAVFRTTPDGRTTASAFSSDLDAYRIPATTGLNLSITAATQPEELAIKAIPKFKDQRVPLTVRVPEAGDYVLNAFTAPILPTGVAAFLEDTKLNLSINLSNQPAYLFSVSSIEAASALTGRFFLRFGPVALPTRSWTATTDVALYPNPARDQVTVQIPGLPGAAQVEATLLNALGQVVRRQQAALPAAGTHLSLDVHGLAAGVYMLRLQANNTVAVRRLVVEQD